ncbi:hypothetical protein ABLE94_20245 [Gordonia sp. VNK1]|uniref:hypothetical protein n=1 Tax=Gordonia oleivorans TaxID=3156618 RepID=UPI0032B433F2
MRRLTMTAVTACAAALVLTSAPDTGAAAAAPLGAGLFPTSWYEAPVIRERPSWLPADLSRDATVILVPGTSDFTEVTGDDIVGGSSAVGGDQYERTVSIGFYDPNDPQVRFVDYPQAFGFVVGDTTLNLVGTGTYNDSVDAGTVAGLAAAEAAWAAQGKTGTIILNGYSQSVPVAMNVAYLLHQKSLAGDPDAIPDADVVVINGADTRFPNTGIESVFPSIIDGVYTNGPRDESATGDIRVISYCVRGDAVCGLGNPLAHPFATLFYLGPGATIHGQKGDLVNQYDVISQTQVGATTYVVLDGGNPWGIFLRSMGIPVPTAFDDALDELVPVPMPGERSTVNGVDIPTPRELQVQIAAKLGLPVPVTDPDAMAAAGQTWKAPPLTTTPRTTTPITTSANTTGRAATTTTTPVTTTDRQSLGDVLSGLATTAVGSTTVTGSSGPAPAPRSTGDDAPTSASTTSAVTSATPAS